MYVFGRKIDRPAGAGEIEEWRCFSLLEITNGADGNGFGMIGGLEMADFSQLVEEIHVGAALVVAVVPTGIIVLDADKADRAAGRAAAEAASRAGTVAEASLPFAGEAAGVGVVHVGLISVLGDLRDIGRDGRVVDRGKIKGDGGIGPAEMFLPPGRRLFLDQLDGGWRLLDLAVGAASPASPTAAGNEIGVGADVEKKRQRQKHEDEKVDTARLKSMLLCLPGSIGWVSRWAIASGSMSGVESWMRPYEASMGRRVLRKWSAARAIRLPGREGPTSS